MLLGGSHDLPMLRLIAPRAETQPGEQDEQRADPEHATPRPRAGLGWGLGLDLAALRLTISWNFLHSIASAKTPCAVLPSLRILSMAKR